MSQGQPHDLYKTGDADAPESIRDRNGEVALALCRRCGKGERDLDPRGCPDAPPDPFLAFYGNKMVGIPAAPTPANAVALAIADHIGHNRGGQVWKFTQALRKAQAQLSAYDAIVTALREIETICTESAGACRKRMGTRAGNALSIARAALHKVQS